MILLGERVDARTALAIGLVDETTGRGQALVQAIAMARRVEKQSPTSVAACKALIQAARGGTPATALKAEREAFVALFDTEDQKEGVGAFLQKRPPQWQNK